jgi:two-component system sensor histidine kinase/response regulator
LSSDALLSVINDVLDFSKIEAGKTELEACDFNLRDNLETILRTFALRASERQLELLCVVDPQVPERVRGDPFRLHQILLNLLGNAIKFTEAGEVALRVQTDQVDAKGCLLHFWVSDTGVGIAPDVLKMIFDPFTQADSSTTRIHGGTGLGLAISARLVKMMDGEIWVESEPGRGSAFHFTALLRAAESGSAVIYPLASPDGSGAARVLIVDDNRTHRGILRSLLMQWGMKPTSAQSGEEALLQVRAAHACGDPYKLMLIDSQMPGMDGFALIECIRRLPGPAPATIMMLTPGGRRGEAARCAELGVSAHVLKPVRPLLLRDAISRVMGGRTDETDPTTGSPGLTREPVQSLRVLLAEDNAVNRMVATKLLEKRGHHVVVTSNGKEALAALQKDTYDLVLMDVQMPEMDGLEATRTIRGLEQGTGFHQQIIALTAHAMVGDRERCLEAGMDGYLTKPLRPQELDQLLASYPQRVARSTQG